MRVCPWVRHAFFLIAEIDRKQHRIIGKVETLFLDCNNLQKNYKTKFLNKILKPFIKNCFDASLFERTCFNSFHLFLFPLFLSSPFLPLLPFPPRPWGPSVSFRQKRWWLQWPLSLEASVILVRDPDLILSWKLRMTANEAEVKGQISSFSLFYIIDSSFAYFLPSIMNIFFPSID